MLIENDCKSNFVPGLFLSDLVQRFDLFVSPASESTPCTTVLTLLIQCLQKVPTVVEPRSQQIVPLFLKFIGYNVYDVVR